jgi:hypothetical protein
MSSSNFGLPTQFEVTNISIDGQDIQGIFMSISIYEDIYRPCITGNIVLTDGDGATDQGSYIEKEGIEFIEPIEFEFKNASGEVIQFKGVLNGLRNEVVKNSMRFYTIDFTSESVRKNESTWIVKSYRDQAPEEIVTEMVEKLGGELETNAKGKKMNYLGSRKRPTDVIKYVLTHGLTQKTEATENEDDTKEEEAKGTTGFLCWETLDGFKFEQIDSIMEGSVGNQHTGFKTLLANRDRSISENMKMIVGYDFTQIGDFQTKLRSGAFGSKNISFDMDKGIYKEYNYYNDQNMTEKQKKAFPQDSISRVFNRLNDNQKFIKSCQPDKALIGDQSRAYLNQNAGMQNTFTDQTGQFTLYPQFEFRAGDSFECQVNKVKDEKADGGPDKKHSGKYIIQQVAHHFFSNGSAYTKIKTIRSTTQQDDSSS